jgi:outer membrane lipoprotein carrier protein
MSKISSRVFSTQQLSIAAAGALAVCTVSVRAQQISTPSRNQPTVQEIARRVDSHYNKLHSLRAGFTEIYEGLGLSRSESGTLLLLKPGRMKWDYSSPAGKLFLLDGKYAWSWSRGASQVQRIPAKQLDDLRSPLRFLLGHTELEKELTNLKLSPGPQGQFTLSGVPKGQENRVQRVSLNVTDIGAITAIEIEETDGAITRFLFRGEEPNAAIPESTFHFTPPPGVPVVDSLPPV